jgi:hypothetical protein
VQQNVIRFEGSIGFEFSAPVAIFVLLREEIFPGRGNGCADATREIFKFAEAELWSGTERRVHTERRGCKVGLGGVFFHSIQFSIR